LYILFQITEVAKKFWATFFLKAVYFILPKNGLD
jgi:hypothetical protein